MISGDRIIKLVDEIDTLNDNLAVAERLVELRFHLERWATEVGDYARELDRVKRQVDDIWRELEEEKALTRIQGEELREARVLGGASADWHGARR